MLKGDFHLHTGEDPHDFEIRYSAKELIDRAAELGFEVLAITCHNRVLYDKELVEHAKKRNILLIPGIERTIENGHVLIYNITNEEAKSIHSFDDLRKLRKRKKKMMVIAAHPFYFKIRSIGNKLIENIDLFDAIEYCHFYTHGLNMPNQKASRVARQHSKPLVGTSDAHHLWRLGTTYTLVDAEKNVDSVMNAIKSGNITLVSRPLSLSKYFRVILWISTAKIQRKFLSLTQKYINGSY